jgi:Ribbon-helix-helix protein, copG family
LTHRICGNILAAMSTLTVNLPAPLAERLACEARQRCVSQDAIIRQALEEALPQAVPGEEAALFERLSKLIVNDPASPTDLAINPSHMEGFGVSRSA